MWCIGKARSRRRRGARPRWEFRPFRQAAAFVRSLGLRSQEQWREYCRGALRGRGRRPQDIPAAPDLVYRNEGWRNWGDWLGTGTEATQLRRYRAFDSAREFVRQLGLRSQTDWRRYCNGTLSGKGQCPEDIPAAPNHVYKEDDWLGWGDWLGTGTVANHRRQFRPFEAARALARGLGLTGESDWRRYCAGRLLGKDKKPEDIPAAPYRTYENEGWLGWGDWLGTGTVAPQLRLFRPFDRAREFVGQLGLQSQAEWIEYCKGGLPHKGKRPDDIPIAPHRVYRNEGWLGWGDWLGTGTVSPRFRRYRSLRRARAFVRRLSLHSEQEWMQYRQGRVLDKGKRPADIPIRPDQIYRVDDCLGRGDGLGTGFAAKRLLQYRAFPEARAFVRQLGLGGRREWTEYCKGHLPSKGARPEDIPVSPDHVYRNQGWLGWGDWLGTQTVATRLRRVRPFQEARTFARSLGLKSAAQWREYCKGKLPNLGRKPEDIPTAADRIYQEEGWLGWGDWLGTNAVAPQLRQFRPLREARTFVHQLGLRTQEEWMEYCKGTVRDIGKKPEDIPTTPNRAYRNEGWVGWADWLGTNCKSRLARAKDSTVDRSRQWQPSTDRIAWQADGLGISQIGLATTLNPGMSSS